MRATAARDRSSSWTTTSRSTSPRFSSSVRRHHGRRPARHRLHRAGHDVSAFATGGDDLGRAMRARRVPVRVPRHRERRSTRTWRSSGPRPRTRSARGRPDRRATPRARRSTLLHRHGMLVVGGLIVGNPDDTRESIEANLAFARRFVDWPYIQHPTPYPGTPMTRDFRDARPHRQRATSQEYDGTTAVVRTEHLDAEEIEFLRWRAERWMKVRHLPPVVRARSRRSSSRTASACCATPFAARAPDLARARERAGGVQTVSIDPRAGTGVSAGCRRSVGGAGCHRGAVTATATENSPVRPRQRRAAARPGSADDLERPLLHQRGHGAAGVKSTRPRSRRGASSV